MSKSLPSDHTHWTLPPSCVSDGYETASQSQMREGRGRVRGSGFDAECACDLSPSSQQQHHPHRLTPMNPRGRDHSIICSTYMYMYIHVYTVCIYITRYGSTLYIGIAMVVPIPQYIRKRPFLLSVSSEFDF